MQIFTVGQIDYVHYLRIDPEELLLEMVEEVARQKNVRDGVVLSTVGSLSFCRIHIVTGDGTNPVQNKFIELSGSIEIVSMSGMIVDYEPHLHMCVMLDKEVAGGHVEHGCRILTMAEISIGAVKPTGLRRVRTPEITGYHYKNLRETDQGKE